MDKIKAYPLIYSRTKFVDYIDGGIVRPHNIDTEKASEYMMASMHRIEYLDNGIRYCVFKTVEYIIYGGTACIPHKLVQKIKQIENKEQLDLDYEDYLTDKFGRPVIFFIGFAVKASDFPKGKTIKLSLFETYKKYIEFLKDQWDSPVTKAKLLSENDAIELELVDYKDSFNIRKTPYEKLNFVENFDENNYQSYIDYFFTEMINNPSKDLSFLSNVFPDDVTADYPFKNISLCKGTPEECINYIESSKKKIDKPKEENINSSNFRPSKPQNNTREQVRRPELNDNDNYVKKNFASLIKKWGIIILITIIVVIILFALSLKKAQKPLNISNLAEPQPTETQPTEEISTKSQNGEKESPNTSENPKEAPDNQIIM